MGVIFLFRVPSFFEPFWYGDEMIYLTLGEGVRKGLVLYRDLHDNKPPLLYLVAAVAGNVFWFKVILAFWIVISVVLFWKLTKYFFDKNEKLQKVATWTFAILTTIPLLEGNIANAEVFLIGPVMAAILILLSKKPDFKNIFAAGVLFGIAVLFKVPAIFDLPVIIIYWLITQKLTLKNFLETSKKTCILMLGFVTPVTITFIWFYFQGALPEYFKAAYLQNLGYLSSWSGGAQKPFWERNLPLLIRAGIVALGLLVIFIKKNRLSKPFIFVSIWVLLGLFAVTLSGRPYPHYLIQVAPEIAIFVGILVASKTAEQVLVIIPLFLLSFVPFYYKYYYYQTFSYYTRFAHFAVGKFSRQEYFSKFDSQVTRTYEVSKFITTSTSHNDKIFVWGDTPAIYALSRRLPPVKYTASYHIKDFWTEDELVKALNTNKPKLVVTIPEYPLTLKLQAFLSGNYVLVSQKEGAKIWLLTTKL